MVSWVLLAKYHRHVQNFHFTIIACYRLLSIVIDSVANRYYSVNYFSVTSIFIDFRYQSILIGGLNSIDKSHFYRLTTSVVKQFITPYISHILKMNNNKHQ